MDLERPVRVGTVTKHLGIPCDRTFETNLFAAEADPKKVRSPRVLGKADDPPKVPKPNVGKAKLIFAGPCALGVLDPVMFSVFFSVQKSRKVGQKVKEG